jgi:hypothetical protein
MENERMYLISEDTYCKHIDEKVHLYSLLRQLAFCAEKVKDVDDMVHFQDTAVRYGEIADEMFEGMNIPGRYLVYGDKSDLHALREKELGPIDGYESDEDSEDEGDCVCPRYALESIMLMLGDLSDLMAEALIELDA